MVTTILIKPLDPEDFVPAAMADQSFFTSDTLSPCSVG